MLEEFASSAVSSVFDNPEAFIRTGWVVAGILIILGFLALLIALCLDKEEAEW